MVLFNLFKIQILNSQVVQGMPLSRHNAAVQLPAKILPKNSHWNCEFSDVFPILKGLVLRPIKNTVLNSASCAFGGVLVLIIIIIQK